MVSAIGSSAYTSQPGIVTSTSGLEAQLARYQKELSDCVNCDTANTREGRETIQALSNKINQIKARIEASAVTKSSTSPSAANATDPDEAAANRKLPAPEIQGNAASETITGSDSEATATGRHVDVFA